MPKDGLSCGDLSFQEKRNLLFLKKREQKDFIPGAVHPNCGARSGVFRGTLRAINSAK
jgi:hypothetical protein